jgi:predicted RND superfamily exporter protein
MSNSVGARLLDRTARLLTEHRFPVLVVIAIITIVLGMQIPKIHLDPAPENLVGSFEGPAQRVDARFRRSFGDTSRVLVVLVSSDDVLSQPALQYQHDLAREFQRHRAIKRVEGLTVMALPRRVPVVPSNEPINLDDLERQQEEEASSPEDDFDPGVYNALLELTEADPEHFPGGIDELGPALQDELHTDPIVSGDRIPAEAGPAIASALEGAPLLVRRLISPNHRVAAVALFVKDIPARDMPDVVRDLEGFIARHHAPRGVEARIAGLPFLRATMVQQMRKDQLVLVPLTVLLCAFLLYLSMRWWPGVILPLAAVVICAIWTIGGMAAVGEPLNVLNNLIPPLLIIIGISEAIHIVERYREELARVGDRLEAGKLTVSTMAAACFLTTLTTAVGFAALLVSKTVMLRHFGLTSAIGVMLSYVVTMTFVPPILTWMKAPPPAKEKSRGRWLDALIVRITVGIIRHPIAALIVTFSFVIGCFIVKQRLVVDHALLDQFRETDEVYISTRIMEENLDGIRPLEVMFDAPSAESFDSAAMLEHVSKLEEWARRRDGVISATSYVDVLRQSLSLLAGDADVWSKPFANDRVVKALRELMSQRSPNPLDSWLTPNHRTIRLQIKLRDIGAQGTLQFLNEFNAQAATELRGTGVEVQFTGEAYTGSRGQQAVIGDLQGSLMMAIVLIFLQVSLLFRSVRLGMLCIPPNLVPLAGTVAYMVLRGIPLNTATVIIFSISIGLADYGTIHVLSRFQEETRRGLNVTAAIIRSARGTGRAVVVANLTLMAGFGVLLFSNFRPVQHFGELIAVTVAGCLFATLFMQPALLKLWGLSREERDRLRNAPAK